MAFHAGIWIEKIYYKTSILKQPKDKVMTLDIYMFFIEVFVGFCNVRETVAMETPIAFDIARTEAPVALRRTISAGS